MQRLSIYFANFKEFSLHRPHFDQVTKLRPLTFVQETIKLFQSLRPIFQLNIKLTQFSIFFQGANEHQGISNIINLNNS